MGRALNALNFHLTWEYPPGELDDILNSNFLDAVCVAFARDSLQEVIDYRGAHGVRLVHNGVVDYMGMWLGHLGTSDATNGAVLHVEESMDDYKRTGKHILHIAF